MLYIRKKQLQRFLDPLGIQLSYNIKTNRWRLLTSTNADVGIKFSLDYGFTNTSWENYVDLLHDIFDVGKWFVILENYHWNAIVENIYIGTKSLEELQIRKDLLRPIA